jgi:redox-sensitive bicupin YhaK (pirin superfamily)
MGMIQLRKSSKRGLTEIDWLKSYHSFSFGNYYDPKNMGYRSLRVINEDFVAPGMGFGRHPHKNMEIVTLVLRGELRHEDSLGSSSVINKDLIQKMSAGKGIFHSEFNNSSSEEVHLYQIWIEPSQTGLQPSYEEAELDHASSEIYLAGDKEKGALVSLVQDAGMSLHKIGSGSKKEKILNSDRYYYFQVMEGEGEIGGEMVRSGDAVIVENEGKIEFLAEKDLRVIEFSLA